MNKEIVRFKEPALIGIQASLGMLATETRNSIRSLEQAMQMLEAGNWIGSSADAFYNELGGCVLPQLHRLADTFSVGAETVNSIREKIAHAQADADWLLRLANSDQGPAKVGPVQGIRFPPPGPITPRKLPLPPPIGYPSPRQGDYPILPPRKGISEPGSIEWLAELLRKRGIVESKSNPEDRRLEQLCRMYGCSDDQREQIGDAIHDEKKGGGGEDGKNLPERRIREIIEEILGITKTY